VESFDPQAEPVALSAEQSRFIEQIGVYYENFGIPRIGGRMFGLFLVTTNPLSAEELAQTLKASRSSISTNVRGLVANGWVEKVTIAGDRTEYFRLAPAAWEQVMERRRQSLTPLRNMAEQILETLPKDHPAYGQLEHMATWVTFLAQHYTDLLEVWKAQHPRR
jgi:DNA-binding transcriptional regulator GbsR (MarR family)